MVVRVRRALLAGVVALLGMSGTAAAQTATPLAAQVPAVGSPLVKGDWPDPDLSLVGGAYYTVATSTNWAPTFRVLRSTDLRNSGFKLAPVDLNLFPGGFNNLNDAFMPLCVQAAQVAIERICPDAWILQAGNPVFEGTTLMTRETGIQACGLCHGHYGYRTVARVIGLVPEKVTFQAPGLNHNIWMTHFYHEGQDAYPLLDDWIANKAEEYWAEADKKGVDIPAQMSRAAIHQYKMFGLMPIGDTPRGGGWWYHTDMDTRRRWYGATGGGDTPEGRDKILRGKDEKYEQMKQAAYGDKVRPIDLFGNKRSSEQHIPIIDGLVNDHEGQFQVNVPNNGALAGLPDDVVVEVPAIVNIKGIQPLCVGELPAKVMLTKIIPDWLDMEVALEALLSGDKSMLLYGVLQSHQTRSYDQAVEVMEALMHMEPSEPMAYLEDINEHYQWPDIW